MTLPLIIETRRYRKRKYTCRIEKKMYIWKNKLIISFLLVAQTVCIIFLSLSHCTVSPYNSSSSKLAIGPARNEILQENSSLGRPGADGEDITPAKLFQELKVIQRRHGQEIFLLIVICIVLVLILFSNNVNRVKIANLTDIFQYIKRSIPTLERTKPSKHKLENSICVVGFDEGESQRKHVEMAKDLVESTSRLQMKSVVVSSLESLCNIPPSKIFLMFVDYNERNIIIEDDSIKDGIRRQTLDVLQEKGAEVIVIYCWELSSARLEEGHLFAPKLASIGQSPRLRQLRDNNAIFSIYKTFNQHQKAAFQRKLGEVAVVVM
uniref:Uncharacterized protein LOC111127493 n=1 Tax=Crassostrea virginica TaxID=6565 RepID=A0A8B8DN35_CRAVI|nr:uncharacterized protein LOC111127493 [Crassostrea virginica]